MACNGLCQQYEVTKPTVGGRYDQGQKRCQVCEVFLSWDGKHCPCCNYRLREKPRNMKYKDKVNATRNIKRTSNGNNLTDTGFSFNGKPVMIDENYLDSVPRPTTSSRKLLKESIMKEGLHEALTINKNNILLDGHTRIEICQELHLKPRFVVKDFEDLDKEKFYVVTVNLKRRHLNDFQICELLEDELIKIRIQKKKEGYSTLGGVGAKKEVKKGDMPREERSPFFEVGNQLGMNATRIEDIMRIKKYGSERLLLSVRNGDTSITDAMYQVRKEQANKPRYNFKHKKLPAKEPSPFKFCPCCGTETLEVWFSVKEKHCTKCDFYYELKRRKHK